MNATDWSARLAMPVIPERDHLRGPLSAPVNVVEYGDYECPYCRAAHPIVTALLARLQNRVCFVYRHFPLTTVHPHAQSAAEAAEAAGAQGKFWPMHDALFSPEAILALEWYLSAAEAFGLDVGRFHDELIQHTHLPRVREDFMNGVRSGVNGTPTFYINGVRHDGAWDFPTLLAAINRALAAASARRRRDAPGPARTFP